MGQTITYLIPLFGVLGLIYTFWKSSWVTRQEVGTERMAKIAQAISEGAMAFLKAEYFRISVFVAVATVLLVVSANAETSFPLIGLSFLVGAGCSALAGDIGMRVATNENVRTTNAARTSLGKALKIAFAGGSVVGRGVCDWGVRALGVLSFLH